MKLTTEKIDKQIFQLKKILKATKIEYQKLFNEMKSLQEEIRKHKQQQQQQQQQQETKKMDSSNNNSKKLKRKCTKSTKKKLQNNSFWNRTRNRRGKNNQKWRKWRLKTKKR